MGKTNPKNKLIDNKKIQSPEKLNEYIRVGNTGGFLLIIGLVILAAALVVWGFTGSIPVTTSLSGVVMESEEESHTCLCFLNVNDDEGNIPEGNAATVSMADGSTYTGSVSYMDSNALSAEEIWHLYSVKENESEDGLTDWILSNLLGDGQYFYVVVVETEDDISAYWHRLADATVVLREVKPISYLLGS